MGSGSGLGKRIKWFQTLFVKTNKTSTNQKIQENKGSHACNTFQYEDSRITISQTLWFCCKNKINGSDLSKPKIDPIIYTIITDDKGGILSQSKGGGLFKQVELEQLTGWHLTGWTPNSDLEPAACADESCFGCMRFCKSIDELQMILDQESHLQIGRSSGPKGALCLQGHLCRSPLRKPCLHLYLPLMPTPIPAWVLGLGDAVWVLTSSHISYYTFKIY